MNIYLDWTSIPYDIGQAIIKWIYTNDTPTRLLENNSSDNNEDENDSFVLTLMKTAKSFGLQDLMNRCEESLVARVQVNLKSSVLIRKTVEGKKN